MQFLDKYGWPVEVPKGRPIIAFLRRLIHTRKIRRGAFPAPRLDPSNQTQQRAEAGVSDKRTIDVHDYQCELAEQYRSGLLRGAEVCRALGKPLGFREGETQVHYENCAAAIEREANDAGAGDRETATTEKYGRGNRLKEIK